MNWRVLSVVQVKRFLLSDVGQASACHGCFMEILGIVSRFSMEPAVLVRRL